jgi:RNase adaptor protein for sRNA GlmZ degradation
MKRNVNGSDWTLYCSISLLPPYIQLLAVVVSRFRRENKKVALRLAFYTTGAQKRSTVNLCKQLAARTTTLSIPALVAT